MSAVLLRGGRVVDPANGVDAVQDVLIEAEMIKRVGPKLRAPEGTEIVDAAGKIVCPGFIDIHVHLREPGQEYKETVATARGRPRPAGSPRSAAWPTRTPSTTTAR